MTNKQYYEKQIVELKDKNKELEQENADLKKRLAFARAEFQRQCKENAELRDNYDQFKASAIPEIEKLQKENAELIDRLGVKSPLLIRRNKNADLFKR